MGLRSRFKICSAPSLPRLQPPRRSARPTPPRSFLFRGGQSADWSLISSFDRFASELPITARSKAADELLTLFGEECEELGLPFDGRDHELLALAQHNGVPTRALDWSESPFIAAYFAFSNIDLEDVKRGGEVAIWAIDIEHPAWTSNSGAEVLRATRRGNDRLLRQRGAFTYLRHSSNSLEDFVAEVDPQGSTIWKFRIPRSQARTVVADLVAMGITGTRLFPDPTGAARAAVLRHLLAREVV